MLLTGKPRILRRRNCPSAIHPPQIPFGVMADETPRRITGWDTSRPLLHQACSKFHFLIWRYTVRILTFSTSTNKCTRVKYNKIQFMISFQLLQVWSSSRHSQGVRLVFVFLCSRRFPENSIPVPKHVGVWFLSRTVFYDLYFIVLYWAHLLVDVLNATT